MTTCLCDLRISCCDHLDFSLAKAGKWVENAAADAWHWSVRVLNKHTDLISSTAILAITTCLLASKVFETIPPLLPRLALVVFNFGGIIWLNVQVRDLIKSCKDLHRAALSHEWHGVAITAAKVFMKATNALLTCGMFAASVIAAAGFPHLTMAMYLAMRPAALVSLAVTIGTDIYDYIANNTLLEDLDRVENSPRASRQIAKVMICFLEVIVPSKAKHLKPLEDWPVERRLADRLVRQLNYSTLETFQEGIANKTEIQDSRVEALKLFYKVKDGMVTKQAMTASNLSLIVLGYISMALCRAFPDSVIEWSTRWMMSVLYTDELVRDKLFQADLSEGI